MMKYKLLSSAFYQSKDFYEQLYTSRMTGESTYKFSFLIKGNPGFVVLNHEILEKTNHILELNQELHHLTNRLPEVALEQYTRTCLIDEIKMTNDIEGVYSTRKEINDIMLDQKAPKKYKRFYALVKKYQTLLNDKTIALHTPEDIKVLYNDFVLDDVIKEDMENTPDGEIFRAHPVYITNAHGQTVHSGLNPEEEIIKCMTESLSMLNSDDYNFLIRIAVFHYMFGYIHPFYDGNGRMSRFISSYLLAQKLHVLVSCRLSCAIKDKLSSYYKSFNIINDEKNRGDLTSFVISFLDIIIAAEQELCDVLNDRKTKLEFYRDTIRNLSLDTKVATIAFILVQNTLFGDTGLTIKTLHEITAIGDTTVRNAIKTLDDLHVLRQDKLGKTYIYDIDLDNLARL